MAESLKLSSEHHNINNIELAGLETKRSDERDLARLGKKAVLKVFRVPSFIDASCSNL